MPDGRVYCRGENDYFDAAEFRVVSGTKIHDREPRHRVTDGVPVVVTLALWSHHDVSSGEGPLEPVETIQPMPGDVLEAVEEE